MKKKRPKVYKIFCVSVSTETLRHSRGLVLNMSLKFYKSCKEETCVSDVSRLFQSLGNREKVSASLAYSGVSGVSSRCMIQIHNYLDSSDIWQKTTPWETEVEYTIPHPSGDVTAFDTSSGADAKLSRKSVVLSLTGSSGTDKNWRVFVTRVSSEPSDKMDFNATRFSWVKVMNIKRFYYETSKSSWVFKLVVCWEGATKEEARAGAKKYFVYVETNDVSKTFSSPSYSTASFLDKVLDIISLDGGSRHTLVF